MQRGLSDGNAVCPSVHHTRVLSQNEVLPTFLYHMKGKFIYFFGHKMICGGRHLLPEILGQTGPRSFKLFKNGDFQSIFARSGSAVTPSGKS